jgi:hypothetical protein
MGKIHTFLFVGLTAVCSFGCGHQISEEEQQVRKAATTYRDAYVDGFSAFGSEDITTNLAKGTIRSVETWSNGWDVVFSTKTGSKQGYILHVFIEPSGKLNKVVRDSH